MLCNNSVLCCLEEPNGNLYYFPNPYLGFILLTLLSVLVLGMFGFNKGMKLLKLAASIYWNKPTSLENLVNKVVDSEAVEKFKDL